MYTTTRLVRGADGRSTVARGGAALFRLTMAATLCAALVLWGLSMTAQAAERYTKDKTKAAPVSSTEAAAQESPAAATSINGSGGPAAKTDTPTKGQVLLGATSVKSPAGFNECVRVALAQSPLLTKSAIEIESRRLDVGDAYSQYIPTLVLNTTYYMRLPELRNTTGESAVAAYNTSAGGHTAAALASLQQYVHTSDPNRDRATYDLSFSTGAWNPLLTAFDVLAKKELVNIAVLAHLKVIEQGLKQLGTTFLQLGMVDTMVGLARDKVELANKNLEYVKTKAGLGQSAQIDVRIAEGKINMVKAEVEKLQTNRAVLLDTLKFIMGVPSIQKVDLDLGDYKDQVLGNFNPANVTDEQMRQHSFTLRIKNYERSLQQKSIALSYIHFLPTFSMGFSSVSTLNSSSYKTDTSSVPFMYPNLNFSLPLDWWTKTRDVSRQYKKLSQLNVETQNLEFQITSEFQQAQARLRAAASDLKFAEANAEVQKLQVQQAQLRFETGQNEYEVIVRAMESYLDSRQNVLFKQQDRNTSMLELRFLSGDFQDRYINATVMENL